MGGFFVVGAPGVLHSCTLKESSNISWISPRIYPLTPLVYFGRKINLNRTLVEIILNCSLLFEARLQE